MLCRVKEKGKKKAGEKRKRKKGKLKMVKFFVESMRNVDSWVVFAFSVISFSVFVNGGGYSGNELIAGLSLIFLIPAALVGAVASANVLFLPVAVIALFAFIISLDKVFDEALWILACMGAFAVMMGA